MGFLPKSDGSGKKGERTIAQTENYKWVYTLKEVALKIPKQKPVVVIGDRESDIYDLFAQPRAANIHLLVRAKHNRHLGHGQKRLFEKVRLSKEAGTISIVLQRTPKRQERTATLRVSYVTAAIPSKDRSIKVSLAAIAVQEIRPPVGAKAISWILLTTVPVTDFDKAKKIIGWYVKRWVIERFHYTLKSGCGIEQLQLQEEIRLERAVALFSTVAWKLLWMTYEAREYPDASYQKVVTSEEWEVLCTVTQAKKNISKTIHEAVRMIAKLGGFLARKGDKEPGVKTLWIGMRRFTDIMTAMYILKESILVP